MLRPDDTHENDDKPRSVSIVAIAAAILVVAGSLLWVFSSSVKPKNFVVMPQDPLGGLERKIDRANYIDRSTEETMFIDGVKGTESPEIALFGGGGKIKGKVLIDGKPGEATVQVARWEGKLYKDMKVNADKEGNFEVNNVLGGRWSARAWAPPTVSVGATNSWFMMEGTEVPVDLNTGRPIKKDRSLVVNPEDRTFGLFTISLTVAEEELGPNGEIVSKPLNENVPVVIPSNYEGPNRMTILDGKGLIAVKCKSFDPVFTTLSRTGLISVLGENLFYSAPLCVAPPPTTAPTPTPTVPPFPTPTTPNTSTTTTIPTSSTIVRPTTTMVTPRGEN